MGSRLIFLHHVQVRWGDGVRKIIRVLDVPVCECRRPAGKSVGGSSRQSIEVLRNRSDRKCFQEKPLSFSLHMTVP